MSKVIGILGGMGPLATVDLFQKILENTPAVADQDHFRILIDCNSKIPSRNQAILANKKSPLREMKKSAQLLERAGVDFIVIPCHTAHYWLEDLRKSVNIPIYSLIEATIDSISVNKVLLLNDILLLSTEATIRCKLYQKSLKAQNISFIIPTQKEQRVISDAIDQVKAGKISANSKIEPLNKIIKKYKEKGISSILAGCTEISLLLPFLEDAITKVDPTLILAQKVVEHAGR